MKSLRSAAITVAIWKRSLLPVVPLPALLAAAFYAGAHVGTRSPMEQGTSTTLGMTAHHGNLPDQVTLATEVQDSFGLSIQSAVVRPIAPSPPLDLLATRRQAWRGFGRLHAGAWSRSLCHLATAYSLIRS
jgi:hypothetical protein